MIAAVPVTMGRRDQYAPRRLDVSPTNVVGLEKRAENPTPNGPRFLTVGVEGDNYMPVIGRAATSSMTAAAHRPWRSSAGGAPRLLLLPPSRSPRPLCPDCGFSRKAESRRHDARPRQSSRMTCMVASPARSTAT
jgi:hypothetical protein